MKTSKISTGINLECKFCLSIILHSWNCQELTIYNYRAAFCLWDDTNKKTMVMLAVLHHGWKPSSIHVFSHRFDNGNQGNRYQFFSPNIIVILWTKRLGVSLKMKTDPLLWNSSESGKQTDVQLSIETGHLGWICIVLVKTEYIGFLRSTTIQWMPSSRNRWPIKSDSLLALFFSPLLKKIIIFFYYSTVAFPSCYNLSFISFLFIPPCNPS